MGKQDEMERTCAELLWEKDETIGRLVKECSGLREVIEEAKRICSEGEPDLEKLSLRGAIRALQRKNKELAEENRQLLKELPQYRD